ncbi:ATP-binding protein [Streptomyces sp. CC224B]|uniref:ATP-binding protein n=1 Tax=Streptomyces sp. CC224B TaxID=3044571 RepID=UPI0024A7E5C8|nr:ATP-binding protein [Streptomyces sp. CC224B]
MPAYPRAEWSTTLAPVGDVARAARLHARTRLPMLGWHGDVETAAQVASRLVDNAMTHGHPDPSELPLGLLLVVTANDELIIAVQDTNPAFPDFAELAHGPLPPHTMSQRPSSLTWIRRDLGGRIACCTSPESSTKTVQVTLPRLARQEATG